MTITNKEASSARIEMVVEWLCKVCVVFGIDQVGSGREINTRKLYASRREDVALIANDFAMNALFFMTEPECGEVRDLMVELGWNVTYFSGPTQVQRGGHLPEGRLPANFIIRAHEKPKEE